MVRTEDSAKGGHWGLGGSRREDGFAFDILTLRISDWSHVALSGPVRAYLQNF